MKTTFRISAPLFERLHRHLFPGDGDEHGALILAGIAETARETRFLAREVILAKDGVDFVPGKLASCVACGFRGSLVELLRAGGVVLLQRALPRWTGFGWILGDGSSIPPTRLSSAARH